MIRWVLIGGFVWVAYKLVTSPPFRSETWRTLNAADRLYSALSTDDDDSDAVSDALDAVPDASHAEVNRILESSASLAEAIRGASR